MGGNAFRKIDTMRRIKREELAATIQYIVDTLNFPGFTLEYANANLMGSTGKKPTSGDIDFAMNTTPARFVGQEHLTTVFNKHEFFNHLETVLPKEQINSTTIKMGNIMTAWPIEGNPENGYIQVDFVFGYADLLKFTHWSPGEESLFKGVFVSQGLGVLAKLKRDYLELDPVTGERVARVGLHLSLEEGLYRKWETRRRPGMGTSECDPDMFETKHPNAPRFTRLGHVQEADAVVQMLLDDTNVTHEDVNTFEKLALWVKKNKPEFYGTFYERVLESLTHSGAKHEYDMAEVGMMDFWFTEV